MIGRLKTMFGLSSKSEKVSLDPISAQIFIATQRNEAASQRARQVLEEMLIRNDGLRKVEK